MLVDTAILGGKVNRDLKDKKTHFTTNINKRISSLSSPPSPPSSSNFSSTFSTSFFSSSTPSSSHSSSHFSSLLLSPFFLSFFFLLLLFLLLLLFILLLFIISAFLLLPPFFFFLSSSFLSFYFSFLLFLFLFRNLHFYSRVVATVNPFLSWPYLLIFPMWRNRLMFIIVRPTLSPGTIHQRLCVKNIKCLKKSFKKQVIRLFQGIPTDRT